jgi:hypothetical protein
VPARAGRALALLRAVLHELALGAPTRDSGESIDSTIDREPLTTAEPESRLPTNQGDTRAAESPPSDYPTAALAPPPSPTYHHRNGPVCARSDCPCTSTYDDTAGSYCGRTCRDGKPCAANYHPTPSGAQTRLSTGPPAGIRNNVATRNEPHNIPRAYERARQTRLL